MSASTKRLDKALSRQRTRQKSGPRRRQAQHNIHKSAARAHVLKDMTSAYLKTEWPDAKVDKALEERLRETCARRRLAEHNGPQLTVVAHQNQMATAEDYRHQTLGFAGLQINTIACLF